jgi:hypothetical protein
MKKHNINIHFVLLILVIIFINLFMSCSITRKVNKQTTAINTEKTTDESVKINSDITTKTGEQIASTTNISENLDTVITVSVLPTGDQRLDEFLKNNPLRIPVKFNRVTQKQEYTTRQESKIENTRIDQNKKQQENSQVISKKKNVDQKSTPSFVFWGLGGIVVMAIGFGIYKSGILKKFI